MSASAQKYIAPIVKGNVGRGGKNLYYNNAGLFSDPYLEQLSKGKHSPSYSNIGRPNPFLSLVLATSGCCLLGRR